MNDFMLGCNYWASHAGIEMWKNWDRDQVEKDFKVLSEELHNKLFEALHCLSPRSRSIIQMFYGISVESRTLEEIGKYFGLTSERIRQLKDEALVELNQLLKQKELTPKHQEQ